LRGPDATSGADSRTNAVGAVVNAAVSALFALGIAALVLGRSRVVARLRDLGLP